MNIKTTYLSSIIFFCSFFCVVPLTKTAPQEDPNTYFQLAEKEKKEKKFAEACTLYEKAYLADSTNFSLCFSCANELFQLHECKKALAAYDHVITLNPSSSQAYFNRGLCQIVLENKEAAIDNFKRAISLNPNYTKAYIQLGETYKKQNKLTQAKEIFQKILFSDQSCFDAHINLARIYTDETAHDKAMYHFKQSLEINPLAENVRLEYANLLNMLNITEEALEIYRSLLQQFPNSVAIVYNIAYTLKKLGKVDEAMEYYLRALKLNPDYAEAHFGIGLAYLVKGNFTPGWKEYEWRWQRPGYSPRTYKEPCWDGSDLTGKTIFIHAEQGLGDTFQFIRYAKLAKEKGGKVIVAVQKPLVQIISLCPYIDRVFTLGTPVNEKFDYQIALLSMPLALNTTLDTIPNELPYLYADTKIEQEWKEKLAQDTNFKIGICWQGNPNYSTTFLRNAVAAKSVSAATFEPISHIAGVSIYSVQRETGTNQLKQLPDTFVLKQFDQDFDQSHGRFMDTAAVMKNLDLIITIDTSICHLAGGLGVPVWLMLPNPADWRWLLDCQDSPWYPGMRLFRQPSPGDWDSVIKNICLELENLVSNFFSQQKIKSAPLLEPVNNVVLTPLTTLIDKKSKILYTQHEKQDPITKEILTLQLAAIDQQLNSLIAKQEVNIQEKLSELVTINQQLLEQQQQLQKLDPLSTSYGDTITNIENLLKQRTIVQQAILKRHK